MGFLGVRLDSTSPRLSDRAEGCVHLEGGAWATVTLCIGNRAHVKVWPPIRSCLGGEDALFSFLRTGGTCPSPSSASLPQANEICE